jgi:hypothetical protein
MATEVFPDLFAQTKADITSLKARVDVLEQPGNAAYIVSASPGVAAVQLPMRSLVYFRTSDGKVDLADNTDPAKVATGITDGLVNADASVVVYGTGAKFDAIGLSGVSNGSRLFLGTGGATILSGTGTGKQIQQVGMYRLGFR